MGGKIPSWVGWLLGALAAIVLAVLGFLFLGPSDEGGTADAGSAPPAGVMAPAGAGAAQDGAGAEAADVAEADAGTEVAEPLIPSFDVVRVKPDGSAVVAGRAAPGAAVEVLLDGDVVFSTTSDRGAGFAALFDIPASESDRIMTLEAVLTDGTRVASEQSVIIAPFALTEMVAAAEGAPDGDADAGAAASVVADGAEGAGAPAMDADADTDVVADADAGTDAEAAQDVVAQDVDEPAAPRVMLAGPEGLAVLQDEGGTEGLSIDSISYDDEGSVALAGRGQGKGQLQIYLDNDPVHTAEVGEDGQWRAPLPEVDTGVYTLRVDEVGPEGQVTSRVETPFKREEPEVIAQVQAEALAAGKPLSSITVQPGHTLWAIAKGRYGEGLLYVQIFEANRGQIRNPDLIYPGQVFSLPDGGSAAEPPAGDGERG